MNIPILSFNSGELSPLIDARTDVEKYSSGCRHLENFYPRIYGAAERRQGTRYVSTQYDDTIQNVRLVPFIYSSHISYSLEFGDQYIRPRSIVTDNGERVYDNSNEVFDSLDAITSPYLAADLFELQFKQIGDTMWIVHSNYPQYKLIRTNGSSFALNEIEYKRGPFLLRNDLIDPDHSDAALMVLSNIGVLSNGLPTTDQWEAYTTTWYANSFTPQSDCTLTSIWLYLWREGSPGDVTIRIRATEKVVTGYDPISPDLVTGTIPAAIANTLPLYAGDVSTGSWTEITISPTSFSGGTTYSVIVTLSGSSSNSIHWGGVRNDSWTDQGNCLRVSSNSGSSWQALDQSIYRFNYRLIGTTTGGGDFIYTGIMDCQDNATIPNPVVFFESGHIGSLFKLIFPRVDKVSTDAYHVGDSVAPPGFLICPPIDIKGSMRFEVKGHLKSATVELQRNENGAGWETVELYEVLSDINTTYTKVEDADNVQYRAVVTAIDFVFADRFLKASITCSNSTQDCIVKVTDIVDSSTASIEVISGLSSTDPTRRWAEGAWSPLRGYPVSMTFFEDRCCFVGMQDIQTQVLFDNAPPHSEPKIPKGYLSHTGSYENFQEDVKDADSFIVTIQSADDVKWIESLEALVIGTGGDEWRVGSNKMQQPITPTNNSVRQQSSYGNKLVQPMKINDQILFVDTVGRKLRESAYDGDKYRAIDLTSLAEHITKSGIVDMAYQRNPDSLIWCVLSDGSLIGIMYEKYEKVIAWFKVPTDGLVQSVCITTGPNEDDVWVSVKRNIAGTDYVFIEKMASRTFDYIEDAYFVDAGLSYTLASKMTWEGDDLLYEGRIVMSGATFSSVSGLSHLNGETVSILADGTEYSGIPVANGTASLPTGVYAQKVSVGLPYKSKLQPMRMSMSARDGSSQGIITRIPKMSMSLLNTMNAVYGTSDNSNSHINYDDPRWENISEQAGLFTGEVEVTVNGGFTMQNPIIISTDSPLPCIVRSISPRLEVTGN